jgi:integrase
MSEEEKHRGRPRLPYGANWKKEGDRYRVDYYRWENGVRKRKRSYFATKTGALQFCAEWETAGAKGEKPGSDREPYTVAEALAFYDRERTSQAVPKSAQRQRRHKDLLLATYTLDGKPFSLAGKDCERLSVDDLDDYCAARKGADRANLPDQRTLGKDLAHLRAALFAAKEHSNPKITGHIFERLSKTERARLMPKSLNAGQVIKQEDFEKILAQWMPPYAERIVRCLLATGLRLFEVCSLDWKDHFRPEDRFTKMPAHFVPITQKKSKPRIIPYAAVAAYVGEPQEDGLVFAYRDEVTVPPKGLEEAEYLAATVSQFWRSAAKRARLRYRIHDLRHTFGSRLRRSRSKEDCASVMGISAATAATYLDHENAALTFEAFESLLGNKAEVGEKTTESQSG